MSELEKDWTFKEVMEHQIVIDLARMLNVSYFWKTHPNINELGGTTKFVSYEDYLKNLLAEPTHLLGKV
jgi:hypothetical protein